jgi:hypothetical protein
VRIDRLEQASREFCPEAEQDSAHPAWGWTVENRAFAWVRPAEVSGTNNPEQTWFADVDGDGLPDGLNAAIPAGMDLQYGYVNFSRRVVNPTTTRR